MRVDDKRGVASVSLTKAETRVFIEAKYLARRLGGLLKGCRVEFPDGQVADEQVATRITATAASLEKIAQAFGAKFLDSKGDLLLSEAEKRRLGVDEATPPKEEPVPDTAPGPPPEAAPEVEGGGLA